MPGFAHFAVFSDRAEPARYGRREWDFCRRRDWSLLPRRRRDTLVPHADQIDLLTLAYRRTLGTDAAARAFARLGAAKRRWRTKCSLLQAICEKKLSRRVVRALPLAAL